MPAAPRPGPFSGAVLCGGASRRMGRDKALIEIDGQAMARRVADALLSAGATTVVAVGGDLDALRAEGLLAVPDDAPGAGPLAGVVTALADLPGGSPTGDDPAAIVFVGGCDLVTPSPTAIAATVAALRAEPGLDAVVPVVDGRRQWMHGAWRRRARAPLTSALDAGERAVHAAAAAAGVRVGTVVLDPSAVADADTPADLPGPARER